MIISNYQHQQSAHCENGTVSNLLNFHKLELSEPMVFGIGSGLFFSYMPFLKLNGMPGTSYRILPGEIFKRLTKRLNIKVKTEKFSDKKKAMDELDRALDKGLPIGMLTSVFYLPYLPKAFRFHFNAHNIVVFGKQNGNYLVSDPVMDNPTEISYEDLMRARFAKGVMPPKGRMYYPIEVPTPTEKEMKIAIVKGINKTTSDMLTIPVPFFGLWGVRYLAKNLRTWDKKLGEKQAGLYLGNQIRMQEEIGTGGAGFRFIFAAFLQEANDIMRQDLFNEASAEMTIAGDRWREFAYLAGKVCKGRATSDITYPLLADILLDCADKEEKVFKKLKNLKA